MPGTAEHTGAPGLDRRRFLAGTAASATAFASCGLIASTHAAPVLLQIADEGWKLWLDRDAPYRDDALHLPGQFDLADLPVSPPTGGWATLDRVAAKTVTLPTTVEEHFWGVDGTRPYTGDEYRYADDDAVPRNGAWRGVSWWWQDIEIPASSSDKRVILHIRGARLRAEVFLNEQLVGYSIMAELPIHCDITQAMRPGGRNRLAIRITNPGGRYDWRDSTTMVWGAVRLFASHGFGGIDRGLTLSAHPGDAHIADAWVLNTPDPHEVTAHVELALATPREASELRKRTSLTLMDAGGTPQPCAARIESVTVDGSRATIILRVRAEGVRLWSLEDPVLYRFELKWGDDTRLVEFGFRWFGVEGIGSNALLRLNGQRVKLYSAISWGYWGFNGLWPTPDLAVAEVRAARALGLNCLHFHRNVGKEEVLVAQDRMGLLRVMEPGGGRHAIARNLKPAEELPPDERFSRDFMRAKCVEMARTFRSHPSLVHYTLQNEIGADLAHPDVQGVLKAIHDTDPSRTVILNDGFVARGAAQAMYRAYDDHYYRSDAEQWGGWWVNHQGAGDQWYDRFYMGEDDYIHRQTGKSFIVEFGEMQGCAVADNHAAMVRAIAERGQSYDLVDHQAILGQTSAFLDRWGFRKAFPTDDALFLSIGRKAYEAWENYLENIRIGDRVDIAAISGWETTAIENHSGIVDNLRGFKADPQIIRRALLPVRPCAKQRRLVYNLGERAVLDLYLFNDTAKPAPGRLTLTTIDPAGRERRIGEWDAQEMPRDCLVQLVSREVHLPPFDTPGSWHVRFAHSAMPEARFERQFWIVAPVPALPRRPRIALSGVARSVENQLRALDIAHIEPFRAGGRYDGIIASGLEVAEIARRQIGEETGLEVQPKAGEKPVTVPGRLPEAVLAAVRAGTPLLALVPEDGLADGVARQLAELGLFSYAGQVGNLRAPWMGNWNYLRAHTLFDGIPADMATSVLHQVEGQPSNGLLVDGEGVEIIAAYSRDHDRRNGAATLIVREGAMRAVVHRLPDMVRPLQQRFYANAIVWLAGESA